MRIMLPPLLFTTSIRAGSRSARFSMWEMTPIRRSPLCSVIRASITVGKASSCGAHFCRHLAGTAHRTREPPALRRWLSLRHVEAIKPSSPNYPSLVCPLLPFAISPRPMLLRHGIYRDNLPGTVEMRIPWPSPLLVLALDPRFRARINASTHPSMSSTVL